MSARYLRPRRLLLLLTAGLLANATDLKQKRDTYLKEHLGGLTEDQTKGVQRKVSEFREEIKQIHIADIDLVEAFAARSATGEHPQIPTTWPLGMWPSTHSPTPWPDWPSTQAWPATWTSSSCGSMA